MIAANPLTNPALCRYLTNRKIPFELSEKYCKEVDFELNNKRYFTIGFENKSGGFELRNQHFKGSSSYKDITLIEAKNAREISVFEGFFSFLSYLKLHQNNPLQLTNFLVLNSLSFFEKSRSLMEEHQKIKLYLGRDEAAIKNTQATLNSNVNQFDKSHRRKNYKDLNDYLRSQKPEIKERLRLGRHFKF